MSIQYILNENTNEILNEKLNQNLEVSSSLKAPIHYVDDLIISKNQSGNLVLDAPIVEATVVQSDSVVANSGVFTDGLNPLVSDSTISVSGNLDLGANGIQNLSSLTVQGSQATAGYVLSTTDNNGTLAWVPDQTGTTPTIAQVLTAGSDAEDGSINNLSQLDSKIINVLNSQNDSTITLQGEGGNITGDTLYINNIDNSISGNPIYVNTQLNCQSLVQAPTLQVSTDNGALITNNIQPRDLFTNITFQDTDVSIPNHSLTSHFIVANVNELNEAGYISVQDNTGTEVIKLDGNNGAIQSTFINTGGIDTTRITTSNSGSFAGAVITASDDIGTWSWEAPASTTPNLGAVLTAGNTASTSINMNNNDITSVNAITSKQVSITNQAGDQTANFICNDSREVFLDSTLNVNNYIQTNAGISTYAIGSNATFESDVATNAITSYTSADITGFGNVSCEQLNPSYKQQYTLYVSKNTNVIKSGSFESPFSSITEAINHAESNFNNNYWFINVGAGQYTEDIIITKKVYITGSNPSSPDSASTGCQIIGNITVSVNDNTSGMTNTIVSLSNLFITNGVIECNSGNTANSTLIINDCYIYNSNGNGQLIKYNPASGDGRLWINNSQVYNTSASATHSTIQIDCGMIKMNQSLVSASGNINVLHISGTARIDTIVLCSFTSNTNSTTAYEIITLDSTGTTFTFSECAFIYSNSANKSASINSCGILLSNTNIGVVPTLLLQFCTFSLAGSSATTNYAIQDSNVGTATQAIILLYANNAVVNTTSQVRGTVNINVFSNSTVGPLTVPRLETSAISVNGNLGSANQYLSKNSLNTLSWQSLPAQTVPSLSQVLAVGSDANGSSITNLNGISSKSGFDLTLAGSSGKKVVVNSDINASSYALTVGSISTSNPSFVPLNITGITNAQNLNVVGTALSAGTLTVNNPTTSTITMTGSDGKVACTTVAPTNITANGSNGQAGEYLKKDPTSNALVWGAGGGGGSQSLASTLAISNSAGTYDIDMNSNDILNTTSINAPTNSDIGIFCGGNNKISMNGNVDFGSTYNITNCNTATASLIIPTNINVGGSNGTAGEYLKKDPTSNALVWGAGGGGGGGFTPSLTYYVSSSAPSGGNGSVSSPFQTIQAAVNAWNAAFDATKYAIVYVSSGSYAGFAITRPGIFIQGYGNSGCYNTTTIDGPVKITSTVNIAVNITQGSINNTIVSFSNLFFSNANIYDWDTGGYPSKSTVAYTMFLDNIQMYSTLSNNANLIVFYSNTTNDVYISNTRVYYQPTTIGTISGSVLSYFPGAGKLTASNLTVGTNQNVNNVWIGGACNSEFYGCYFSNNSLTYTNPVEMIKINSTTGPTANNIIRNCYFVLTQAAAKTGVAAVKSNYAGSSISTYLIDNYFALKGTTAGTSNVMIDGSSNARIYYGGNYSDVGTTNTISATLGTTKFALLAVA